MNHSEIKEKVIGYVHTKDAKSNWILPWGHKADCWICDQLSEFIEGLFKEEDERTLKVLEDALTKELSEVAPKRPITCSKCRARGCCKQSESYL